MSAAGQLRELIENVVQAVTGEYESRIVVLEKKVADLEDRLSPPARKAAAAPSVKARAGSAEGRGTAGASGGK